MPFTFPLTIHYELNLSNTDNFNISNDITNLFAYDFENSQEIANDFPLIIYIDGVDGGDTYDNVFYTGFNNER